MEARILAVGAMGSSKAGILEEAVSLLLCFVTLSLSLLRLLQISFVLGGGGFDRGSDRRGGGFSGPRGGGFDR